MTNLIKILKEDNIDEVSEETGLSVGELTYAYQDAKDNFEVLYVASTGELMPIKSWWCDGIDQYKNKTHPGCKEGRVHHNPHSIWENAK